MKFHIFTLAVLFTLSIIPEVKASPVNEINTEVQKDSLPKKEPKIYTTIRINTEKPIIDGKLDDACWETGKWEGNFIQFVPSEGGIPTFQTQFKILYDDKNIYVAMRAFDNEPDKIQKFAGLRDELLGDMMGINFDSYHDHRTGFEFNMSAYGQKIDLVLSNPMSWDVTWNPVWTGKVGIEDSAWVAEMEIPLNQLRYSNEDEQTWGIHVWRWVGRLSEESDWEYQTLTGPGMLYNFGELRGIKGLQKSKRLEVMPYTLGNLKTFKKEPGNPFTESGKILNGNLGLDVKLGISSNFTLDMTINPDFGQVESDPSVMNLTAFETFYEEKRPFFLEAKSIFKYEFDDLNLFYSRRIGHSPSLSIPYSDSSYSLSPDRSTILSAFKLSGKTSKGLSIGLLQSLTGPEHADISDLSGNRSMESIEPLTNYTVTRIQKDYKAGTTMIGGIFTTTNRFINNQQLNFLSRDAYTGGLDILHQWKEKKYYVDSRLVGSYIQGDPIAITRLQESSARYYQRPGFSYLGYDTSSTILSGYGGRVRVGKGSGLWRYSTGISWFSPGLELNDVGYMQSADAISQSNEISYFVNQPVSIFRTYTISLEEFNSWNFAGKYLGSASHLSFSSEYTNKWGSNLNLIWNSENIDNRILRGGYDMTMPFSLTSFGGVRTDYSKKIFGELSYEYFYRAEKSAVSYALTPGITIRPINTLRINMSARLGENTDHLQFITSIPGSPENKYILGKIYQQTLNFTFRVDYSITPELSFQYYGSPFVSKGNFTDYKEVTDSNAGGYSDRFTTYSGVLDNPDFNFHQFRSNMVAKWEYRPGSFLFLVWSDERTGNANPINTDMLGSMKQLFKTSPGNFFLIKLNYWFSI